MFDIGWSELLVIGALALIVVGPKELPGMLRTCGQYVAKARRMARDFQRTMEDAADAADLGELKDVGKSMADWNRKVGPGAPAAFAKDFVKGADKAEKPAAAQAEASPAAASPDVAETLARVAADEAQRKAEAEAAGQAVPGPSPSGGLAASEPVVPPAPPAASSIPPEAPASKSA